jgi:hypothetical protein
MMKVRCEMCEKPFDYYGVGDVFLCGTCRSVVALQRKRLDHDIDAILAEEEAILAEDDD